MKTWTKRTIAVCLLLALFLTAIPCASAKQYTDVTRSALPDYFDAINYVTDNGIMNGVSTSSFSPNEMVTRAMFITTLYRYAGSPSSFAAVSFTDISSSHYAYNAVKWGVKYNIVTGTTTTTFSPDEQVTREQAMTFLWRYLKNYVGGTPYYYGSISGCGDYSSIYDYARPPMYWAVSNAIIFASGSSKLLYPKAGVYRKELALWITRYGCNVDGIRFGKDNFKFLNSLSNFVFDDMYRTVGNEIYRYRIFRLSSGAYNKLADAATSEELKSINEMLQFPSSGACFGMSLSMLLDKKGIIDFNGNLSVNARTMYSQPAPATSSSMHRLVKDRNDGVQFPSSENIIHLYQLSQNIRSVIKLRDVNTGSSSMYAPLLSALRTYGIVLVGYKTDNTDGTTFAHAIVLYGMPRLVGEYYEISCYDPNLSSEQTIKIKSDASAFFLADGTKVNRRVEYAADFYQFLKLDIDGDYYKAGSVPSNYSTADVTAETTDNQANDTEYIWITVKENCACRITNAEGQSLILDSGTYSGTMDVRDTHYCGYDTEIKTDSYLVPYSQSFVYETSNNDSRFSVDWKSRYCTLDATGAQYAEISTDSVSVVGNDIEYLISISTLEDQHISYELIGNEEKNVNVKLKSGCMEVQSTNEYVAGLYDIIHNTYQNVMMSKELNMVNDYACYANASLLKQEGRSGEVSNLGQLTQDDFTEARYHVLYQVHVNSK